MLKKIKIWFDRGKQDDKGIAILFTLGILSLLLIMAMSFATDSIIERKVAYNNNTRTQAKLLAQSALNRAMAAMRYYVDSATTGCAYSFNNIYSQDIITVNNKQQQDQLQEKLFTVSDNSGNMVPSVISNTDFTTYPNQGATWQYITDPTNTKLIGRFAYAVYVDTGRIDLAAAVDSGVNVTETYSESLDTKPRPGVYVSEMYLKGLNNGTSDLTTTELQRLSSVNATPAGRLYEDKRWVSIDQVLSANILAISATDNKRTRLNQLCNIHNPPDIEAYWGQGDPSADKQKLLSTMYPRFNLANPQADWDTKTVDQLLGIGATVPQVIFDKSSNQNSAYIQFLRKIGDTGSTFVNVGTITGLELRRRQIAANLIDYCDSNSEPTSGRVDTSVIPNAVISMVPTDWTTNAPDYTGNEKTFYINQLAIEVNASINVTYTAASPLAYDCAVSLGTNIAGEIINIYENINPTSDYELILVGQYDYLISGGITDSGTVQINNVFPATKVITPFGAGSISNAILDCTMPGSVTSSSAYNGSAITITIKNVKISKALLKKGSTYVDYANVNSDLFADYTLFNAIPNIPGAPAGTIAVKNTDYVYFSMETADPRQNLNKTDWTPMPTSTTVAGSLIFPGLGNNNTNATPNTGVDAETVTEVKCTGAATTNRISTAYIRNAPMQSPWELGCIHRGAKWETINLKAFPSFDSNINFKLLSTDLSTAGITYAQGDAAILDQVKMDLKPTCYGKVDLNMTQEPILTALVYKTFFDNNYANPGSQSGTEFTTSTDFITQLATQRATLTYKTFLHRSQMAAALSAAATNAGATTDAQKEALIGKIVNLTKAAEPPNEIRVMIIAQTIRDIGGSTAINITKTKVDGSSTVTKGCTLGTFDFDNSTTPYTYFDEITGEQKLFAIVARDPATNKFTIKRLEFINE